MISNRIGCLNVADNSGAKPCFSVLKYWVAHIVVNAALGDIIKVKQ